MDMYLAMQRALLLVKQHNGHWQVEPHLLETRPTCLAMDPFRLERVYCGTFGQGLWYSDDAGHSWQPVGDGLHTRRSCRSGQLDGERAWLWCGLCWN